jgi:hypothetical protein
LAVFLERFFKLRQFKRSAIPNGPKVGSGARSRRTAICGAALTLAAAIWAVTLNLPTRRSVPLLLRVGRGLAPTVSTLKAISINWSLAPWQSAERKVADDERALAAVLQQFERWQALRASLQFLTFAVTVWALAANSTAVSWR